MLKKEITPNPKIYHLTSKVFIDSIIENGLVPYLVEPNMAYPVIYFTNSDDNKELCHDWMLGVEDIILLEIDTTEMNGWIRFYKDNNSDVESSIVCYEPIPPKYIKIIEYKRNF
jgi:hypothetical protein